MENAQKVEKSIPFNSNNQGIQNTQEQNLLNQLGGMGQLGLGLGNGNINSILGLGGLGGLPNLNGLAGLGNLASMGNLGNFGGIGQQQKNGPNQQNQQNPQGNINLTQNLGLLGLGNFGLGGLGGYQGFNPNLSQLLGQQTAQQNSINQLENSLYSNLALSNWVNGASLNGNLGNLDNRFQQQGSTNGNEDKQQQLINQQLQ